MLYVLRVIREFWHNYTSKLIGTLRDVKNAFNGYCSNKALISCLAITH